MGVVAQPRLRKPEYLLGVRGGVIASTVIFNPSKASMTPITNACVLGGNGGVIFRYTGHKYCAFQTELNYLHRGWAEGANVLNNLHYIEIPILMNIHLGSEVCKWFFNFGPQVGYCVYDEKKTIDHPFDWGLTAGTGIEVRTRKAGFYLLEVRFDYSFGGVYGTSVTDTYKMASPMDLSVNLGWLMPIKDRHNRLKE